MNKSSQIYLHRIDSPIGEMTIAATQNGICLLAFTDQASLDNELKLLTKYHDAQLLQGENQHIQQLKKELAEYFSRQRQQFSVSLDIMGTDFQKQVWQKLMTITYGTTCSYQQQANLIGRLSAVRAVANANGKNKISIIIPCHRIIGANGQLTGYAGGLWRKQWLIDFEKR